MSRGQEVDLTIYDSLALVTASCTAVADESTTSSEPQIAPTEERDRYPQEDLDLIGAPWYSICQGVNQGRVASQGYRSHEVA